MLKKTTTAVLTAVATMLSAVSPLATYAETSEHEHKHTIPDRNINQEFMPYSNAPAILDSEMMQTSTIATIPERTYTCTTVPAIGVQPEEFPLRREYAVNVNVLDSKTNEHVDGVKVHFVETQSLNSNLITRDYGTWDSSKSESYTIDIIHLFQNLSSTIAVTAVIEDMPEGYSYLGGTTNVTDFIIDNAMDWYYSGSLGYTYQPRTNLTIYLDKEYHGNFQATCLLIDGNTGEFVEGAEVSLSEWDEKGNLGNCVEWITTGQEDTVNFEYTIPSDSHTSIVQFVADKLPEKYNKYTFCPFTEYNIDANTSEQVFVLYVYEDGEDSDIISTDTTTTSNTCNWTTTTTTNTIIECKACEKCGNIINVNDGIVTPLGLFVCSDCRSAGAGGTRPQFSTDTTTATTTTTTTTVFRECEICGKSINEADGVITPLGLFVCLDCRSAGAGGTRPHFPEDTTTETTTATTTIGKDQKMQSFVDVITEIGDNTVTFQTKGTFTVAKQEDMEKLKAIGTGKSVQIEFLDYKDTTIMNIKSVNVMGTGVTEIKYGDATGDGDVNVADAVLIMQVLSNPSEYKMNAEQLDAADVYNRGDGITTMDALVLQQVSINVYSLNDLPVNEIK